jgi:signal transduction histidine kinase
MTSGYGGDVVLVSVEDQGIGIPEDEQDKIFSKFYRADNATDTETEGTGVGLFITKQIAEAHKGKIWFESKQGEGTTFYVQLPIASDN